MLRNGLEPWHLVVVAIVLILLFGSKKLPDMARGLGKSMRILKSEAKAMKRDGTGDGEDAANPTAAQTAASAPDAITPSEVRTSQETAATTTAK